MRFIGNKENLLDKIYFTLETKIGQCKTFWDFFAGTASVGAYFKRKGYSVFSSDFLYFSYCLQYAYIKNDSEPVFDNLLPKIETKNNGLIFSPLDTVLLFLNNLPATEGFIYQNYSVGGTVNLAKPRMYFSDANAKKIDAVRIQIEEWYYNNWIAENEYYILLACLIESVSFFSNVAGMYAAFQKQWDPRALKPFVMKPLNLIIGNANCEVFNQNSLDLVNSIDTDILYLDPPYNERQYAPNYHLIETIAKYDNPKIKGITGMREYTAQKSTFCNKEAAIRDLDYIAKNAKYKYLVLSYNTEGIMPQNKIFDVLQRYGNIELTEFDYIRFKSNNNGESKTKRYVKEQLYVLMK